LPASSAISAILQYYDDLANGVADPRQKENFLQALAPIRQHLQRLRRDWTATLALSPTSLPPELRPAQETFQFHFAGRTNYEHLTLETLLNPRLALQVDENELGEDDRRQMREAGVRVRLAWFGLLARLGPDVVLTEDSRLMSISIAQQFLRELSKADVAAALLPEQFVAVMGPVYDLMTLTTAAFLDRLAAAHLERFSAGKLRPEPMDRPARAKRYREMVGQLVSAANQFYDSVWKTRPATVDLQMVALARWTTQQLESLDRTLQDLGMVDALDPAATRSLGERINELLSKTSSAHLPLEKNPPAVAVSDTQLSEPELRSVKQLRDVLRYPGPFFKLDCHPRAFLETPKAGRKPLPAAAEGCHPLGNLADPIAILVEHYKRHPLGQIQPHLAAIHAKLEGLREAIARFSARATGKAGRTN
jgi:hypothetical protein